jgi:hypothetical protein
VGEEIAPFRLPVCHAEHGEASIPDAVMIQLTMIIGDRFFAIAQNDSVGYLSGAFL